MRYYRRITAEDAKREALELLASKARYAGVDLNSASEQMFRVSPDCLTDDQRLDLLSLLCRAAREKDAKAHYHFCVECGEAKDCEKTDCEDNETICYRCNEGIHPRTERWLHNKAAVMQ